MFCFKNDNLVEKKTATAFFLQKKAVAVFIALS